MTTIIDEQGNPWWVAKEVCDILGINNSRHAVRDLDDDERNTVTINDGNRGNPVKTVINEPGRYGLVFRYRKPEAKKIPALHRHTADSKKSELPFIYGEHKVTTIIDEQGNPWWVAKEVCDILELTPRDSVRYLDDDETSYVSRKRLGLNPGKDMVLINEPGIYSLIIRSRKPEAKTFKRWITHIVIPEIRTTGGFIHATADMSDDEVLARGYEVSQRKLAALRGQVQELLPKAEGFDHFIDTDMLINQR